MMEKNKQQGKDRQQEQRPDEAQQAVSPEQAALDASYMRAAIRLAKKAAAQGDVPIGCIIVHEGQIIARGYNKRTKKGDVLCHAEIIAIHKACRRLGDWRLENCTLYVTLEPCPMCAGAIIQARIPRVVIGCQNPKAGCAGSILDLLHENRFNHQVDTCYDVLQKDCSNLMKSFFKALRTQAAEEKRLKKMQAGQAECEKGEGKKAKDEEAYSERAGAEKVDGKMAEREKSEDEKAENELTKVGSAAET